MSENTFYDFIKYLCDKHNCSISSMHRTPKHNKKVGGVPNSMHLGYRCADIVADDWSVKDEIIATCESFNIFVWDEVASGNHLHIDDRYNAPAPVTKNW